MNINGAFVMAILSTCLLTALWSEAKEGEKDENSYEKHDKVNKKQTETSTQAPMDPIYKKECGSCHFPFPVGMLPERSWRLMMANLTKHFGEDATLPEGDLKQILAYAIANSGERSRNRLDRHMVDSIPASLSPLRISEVPYFIKEHKETASHLKPGGPVSHWSSCQLCHTRADVGSFDEHEIQIPKAKK